MKDICEGRHGGNAESVAAGERVQHSAEAQRAWCLDQIGRAGPFGRTCDELAATASRINGREVPPNRISGRLSELKAAGAVVQSVRYPTRATRTGSSAAVLVLPRWERGDCVS